MERAAKWWCSERACLRPDGCRGRQAFLLVEATLTGVVMAVGLACVSRAMSGPLHVLSRIRQTDAMLQFAESVMNEREAEAAQGRPLACHEGVGEAPDGPYRWAVRVQPAIGSGSAGGMPTTFRLVTLTVSKAETQPLRVSLTSVWPSEWVQE